MWAGAHEIEHHRRNTLVMSSRHTRTESTTAADVSSSFVSEWRDAATLMAADLSGEVAGQRIVPLIGHSEQSVVVDASIERQLGSLSGTPGFLFNGDDGDSLWFWPEDGPVAFRFEPGATNRLRSVLAESVSRLVSQGALVFCYEERDSVHGDPVFHFPELELRAA